MHRLTHLVAWRRLGGSARDPPVFTGAPLVLLLIAFAAVSLPGYRASRVDPVDALRTE